MKVERNPFHLKRKHCFLGGGGGDGRELDKTTPVKIRKSSRQGVMDYVTLKDSGKDGEQLMPETTVSRKSTAASVCGRKTELSEGPWESQQNGKAITQPRESFDTSSFFNPHHSPLGWAFEMAK